VAAAVDLRRLPLTPQVSARGTPLPPAVLPGESPQLAPPPLPPQQQQEVVEEGTPGPVTPNRAQGRPPARSPSSVWKAVLGSKRHLRTTDVHLTCGRFRQLRAATGSNVSDSMLTPEDLAMVLGFEVGAAAAEPLFRLLLVAMAGLTRAKVIDRMRFAALLLDDGDSGWMALEQLALILHANGLLFAEAPLARVDFEPSARALIALAPGDSSSAAGTRGEGISHADFLELVRQNPWDLFALPEQQAGSGCTTAAPSATASRLPSPRGAPLGKKVVLSPLACAPSLPVGTPVGGGTLPAPPEAAKEEETEDLSQAATSEHPLPTVVSSTVPAGEELETEATPPKVLEDAATSDHPVPTAPKVLEAEAAAPKVLEEAHPAAAPPLLSASQAAAITALKASQATATKGPRPPTVHDARPGGSGPAKDSAAAALLNFRCPAASPRSHPWLAGVSPSGDAASSAGSPAVGGPTPSLGSPATPSPPKPPGSLFLDDTMLSPNRPVLVPPAPPSLQPRLSAPAAPVPVSRPVIGTATPPPSRGGVGGTATPPPSRGGVGGTLTPPPSRQGRGTATPIAKDEEEQVDSADELEGATGDELDGATGDELDGATGDELDGATGDEQPATPGCSPSPKRFPQPPRPPGGRGEVETKAMPPPPAPNLPPPPCPELCMPGGVASAALVPLEAPKAPKDLPPLRAVPARKDQPPCPPEDERPPWPPPPNSAQMSAGSAKRRQPQVPSLDLRGVTTGKAPSLALEAPGDSATKASAESSPSASTAASSSPVKPIKRSPVKENDGLTLGQYVVQRQRRKLLQACRCCAPMKDSQPRLLMTALVFLLFAGGMFTALAGNIDTNNFSLTHETQMALAIFLACAGFSTICYCVCVREVIDDEEAPDGVDPEAPDATYSFEAQAPGYGFEKQAQPHALLRPGDYKEKMRMIKEVRAFVKEEQKQQKEEQQRLKDEQIRNTQFPDEAETQRRRLAIRRMREERRLEQG